MAQWLDLCNEHVRAYEVSARGGGSPSNTGTYRVVSTFGEGRGEGYFYAVTNNEQRCNYCASKYVRVCLLCLCCVYVCWRYG